MQLEGSIIGEEQFGRHVPPFVPPYLANLGARSWEQVNLVTKIGFYPTRSPVSRKNEGTWSYLALVESFGIGKFTKCGAQKPEFCKMR